MKSFKLISEMARDSATEFIDSLPLKTPHGQHYEVVIRLYQKKANHEQRKRHWARMGWVAENVWLDGKAYSKDTWHEYFKQQIIGFVDLPNGGKMGLPSPSTAKEYAEFDEAIDRILSADYGVWIIDPGEAEYEGYARRTA